MDKQVQISITPATVVMTVAILAITWAVWLLHGLVLLVLTAIVIASAIEPGVSFFTRRKFPRVVAVLLMYFLVFGSLFSAIYFFFPPILADAQSFIIVASHYLDTITLPGQGPLAGFPSLSGTTGPANSIVTSLLSFRNAFSDPSAGALRLVATFFGGIFSLLLVVVLSFYFTVQDTGVEEFLKLVTPAKNEEYVVGLWHRAQKKIGLWMQGQLLSSLIGGVIAYLGLLILGVPYALLLAAFTAFAMLVPIFGSFIAALPAVVIAFTTGDLTLTLIVAGLYLIINQFETHLIHPLVVNKVVGIPPLLVILALIIGGELAGFLGVVLAIPFAAALREFLADIARNKRKHASGS